MKQKKQRNSKEFDKLHKAYHEACMASIDLSEKISDLGIALLDFDKKFGGVLYTEVNINPEIPDER